MNDAIDWSTVDGDGIFANVLYNAIENLVFEYFESDDVNVTIENYEACSILNDSQELFFIPLAVWNKMIFDNINDMSIFFGTLTN